MTFSNCVLNMDGAIARLTLNRPERRNAVSQAMILELTAAARALAENDDVRAVILDAAGADFSVGADLEEANAGDAAPSLLARRRAAERGGVLMQALQDIRCPTIAAVQGIATGAGACIAAACDFRIAARSARIGFGEVKIGINLMWRALPICVRLVGPSRAKQMLLSGDLFAADTLERWAFVDEMVDSEHLASRAQDWAQRFAALPPIAVQMIKRSVNVVASAMDPAVMHMDADQWLLTAQSEDAREAVTAFFEKRPGKFVGN